MPARMRDGTILRADVYRPTTGGPYPVILSRTPYGKSGYVGEEERARELAAAGYVAVIQDIRGRFASEGEFIPMYVRDGGREDLDGFDTVQWAASLPGTTGQVAVLGSSYPAALAWELAPTRPPALAAMWVQGMVGDSRDTWSGAIRLSISLPSNVNDFPPDYQAKHGGEGAARSIEEAYRLWEFEHGEAPVAPTARRAAARALRRAPHFVRWLAGQNEDTVGYRARMPDVACPVLHVGSWHDPLVDGIDLYSALVAEAATETARAAQRLVVGPWTHEAIGARAAGDLDFGPDAETSLGAAGVRFFDFHLKGIDHGPSRRAAGEALRDGR